MEKRSFYLQFVCIIILLSFLFFSSESADHVTANHSKTPKLKEKSAMQQKYLGESKVSAIQNPPPPAYKAIGSRSPPGGTP
ncbi:hypothetical protein MANES_17G094000v8 [Manihot esculenta]|uniref:Uncharacterized protein n=1 Tax=Manihot esculenta TaxID=3983 RepID=A0A2C9U7H3_MANES|nr:hypothetical protein MANES_17G094000v8 [Manihot esculenta]